MPCTPLTLADPFSQYAWRKRQSHFFHLAQIFMADFVDIEKLPRLSSRQIEPCSSVSLATLKHTVLTSSITFLSTGKCHLCCVRPPLAAHKTPIPSCKAICLETLCGGHPCLSRAPACWWLFQSFLTGWQAEWSRAHSPRPQASPSLPDSSVYVCSSSPWFL